VNHKLKAMIEAWKATGRVAFIHPRGKTVSLNGGGERDYKKAEAYLSEYFKINPLKK
jgi:hypothetical protein